MAAVSPLGAQERSEAVDLAAAQMAVPSVAAVMAVVAADRTGTDCHSSTHRFRVREQKLGWSSRA
jgi:hypothetical protein